MRVGNSPVHHQSLPQTNTETTVLKDYWEIASVLGEDELNEVLDQLPLAPSQDVGDLKLLELGSGKFQLSAGAGPIGEPPTEFYLANIQGGKVENYQVSSSEPLLRGEIPNPAERMKNQENPSFILRSRVDIKKVVGEGVLKQVEDSVPMWGGDNSFSQYRLSKLGDDHYRVSMGFGETGGTPETFFTFEAKGGGLRNLEETSTEPTHSLRQELPVIEELRPVRPNNTSDTFSALSSDSQSRFEKFLNGGMPSKNWK